MYPIYALFFLSGISGLIYQVVWVREFAYVFGNSIYSASIISAIFMGGLGLGGWAVGGWIDARFRSKRLLPLRMYGYFEALIGLAALATALLLPNLGALSAGMSDYVRYSNGWHTLTLRASVLRYTVPIVLLTPVTALMGATLTLLIRFVVANEVSHAGFRIGLLYGFNTAGAALGCVATDLFLVPHVGLFATQAVAALGNFAAALGALRWAARLQITPTQPSDEVPHAETQSDSVQHVGAETAPLSPVNLALLGASGAVLLSGAVGMGMEIVWFRYLISLLGGYREVFSLLLGTILIGMWLGSVLAGTLHRRFGKPAALYASAQGVLMMTTVAPLGWISRDGVSAWGSTLESKLSHASAWFQPSTIERLVQITACGLVTAVPAMVLGMTFPLANAAAQDHTHSVGRRAGILYAANTFGAVVGAALAGFWLLPHFGTQVAVFVLLCCSTVSLVPLLLTVPPKQRLLDGRFFIASGLIGIAVLIGWSRLPSDWLVERSLPTRQPDEQKLMASEGIGETIVITEREGMTTLFTNGHSMSSTSFGSQRYMRLFAHLPLLSMDHATDALVICYGVGNTLNATLMHPEIQRVDMVDISAHVLEQSHYFHKTNGAPLTDPRVSVFVNDGRHHLRMVPPATYDLITAEPPPIAHAGVSALYSTEFYQLARNGLKPGGIMTHWLPIDQVAGDIGLSVVRSFVDVFPNAVLLDGFNHDLILVGVNGPAPFRLDPALITKHLQGNPKVAADLDKVGAGTLLELAGLFVASPRSLQEATRGILPVTDDYPIMEYGSGRWDLDRIPIASELFRPMVDFDVYCPTCGDPAFGQQLTDLPVYLALTSQVYASEIFRARTGSLRISGGPDVGRVIKASPYLRALLGSKRSP